MWASLVTVVAMGRSPLAGRPLPDHATSSQPPAMTPISKKSKNPQQVVFSAGVLPDLLTLAATTMNVKE
jgi:hypothetical protein